MRCGVRNAMNYENIYNLFVKNMCLFKIIHVMNVAKIYFEQTTKLQYNKLPNCTKVSLSIHGDTFLQVQ